MDRNNWRHKRRREIAEGLHWLVADAGPGGVKDRDLFRVLGIGFGDDVEYSDAQDVEHLANLIDRPVCRFSYTDNELETVVRCSRCGETLLEPLSLNYCPNCGAEVVE